QFAVIRNTEEVEGRFELNLVAAHMIDRFAFCVAIRIVRQCSGPRDERIDRKGRVQVEIAEVSLPRRIALHGLCGGGWARGLLLWCRSIRGLFAAGEQHTCAETSECRPYDDESHCRFPPFLDVECTGSTAAAIPAVPLPTTGVRVMLAATD